MPKNKNKVAYIDGANLHKAALQLGWHLDYARLRVWLTEKYGVNKSILAVVKEKTPDVDRTT